MLRPGQKNNKCPNLTHKHKVEIIHSAGLVGAVEFSRQRVLLASLFFYRASKELLQSKPAAAC
jgi:hypothetical protein